MNKVLSNIVSDCIATHVGGEKFFDELDRQITTSSEVCELLLNLVVANFFPLQSTTFILSGKFGREYEKYLIQRGYDSIVVLEGNLRNNEIENIQRYYDKIHHKLCIFIDDSYFAGRTYNKVRDMVEKLNGNILGCVVAYDGSKSQRKDVISLYRYYDMFGEEK